MSWLPARMMSSRQRKVEIGQLVGELRVVTTGIQPEDRICRLRGLLSAIPGQKIEPQLKDLRRAVAANGAGP